MSQGAGQNPLVNIARFGFQPQGAPVSGTGTDFRHEPHILIGLPVRMIRFGFMPVGSPAGTTGTDFRHEPHILMGLPVHMVRFGFMPVGTAGTGARVVGGMVGRHGRRKPYQTLEEFEANRPKPFGRKWFEEFKAAELAARQAAEAKPNKAQRKALTRAVKAAETVEAELSLVPYTPDLRPFIAALHAAALASKVKESLEASRKAVEQAKAIIEAIRQAQDDDEEALMLLLH